MQIRNTISGLIVTALIAAVAYASLPAFNYSNMNQRPLLCFLAEDIDHPYWQAFLFGLKTSISERNYQLQTFNSNLGNNTDLFSINALKRCSADNGAVLYDWSKNITNDSWFIDQVDDSAFFDKITQQHTHAFSFGTLSYQTELKAELVAHFINEQSAKFPRSTVNFLMSASIFAGNEEFVNQVILRLNNTVEVGRVAYNLDKIIDQSVAFSQISSTGESHEIIVGSSVAIKSAHNFYSNQNKLANKTLIATEISPEVTNLLASNEVAAVINDNPILLAKHLLVTKLEQTGEQLFAPNVELLTADNVQQWRNTNPFAPHGYRSIFNVN